MAEGCHPGGGGATTADDVPTGVLRIALAGNPNVGKSSLFNRLTGSRQHVGNWPGKTVERRTGTCRRVAADGVTELALVDLPGTYSLAASSPEELVAEQALTGGDIDVVAAVLDSTNLERNLYLATQLAELGLPLVLVLNLSDAARDEGIDLDVERLAATFGVPVVRTAARSGEGLDDLLAAVRGAARPTMRIDYGPTVEEELRRLEQRLAGSPSGTGGPAPDAPRSRWTALRLLEGDPVVLADVGATGDGAGLPAAAEAAIGRVRAVEGVDPALLVADRRFAWAHHLASAVTVRTPVGRHRTDRLDDVLTHPWLGVPILLGLLWLVFTLVVEVADPFVGWIEELVEGPLRGWGAALFAAVGLDGGWVEGLVLDGALVGVGAVLVFVPVLTLLYVALGMLEDSGYLARAAYLMDRVMTPIGLSGKSFLPLLLGFGCNVPAVYATRVLDGRRERLLTALLLPFVSCAARLPVYVLLASVFFPAWRGTVVFAMYLLSIVSVLGFGALLDRLLLRDERGGSFVLELPPYRAPSPRVLGRYVQQRVGAFVRNAGTVILGASLLVWLLLAVPVGGAGRFADVPMEDSAFAATAQVVAPALAPAGLNRWEVSGTLLSGLVAKEVMVATLWQVHAPGTSAAEGSAADGSAADGSAAEASGDGEAAVDLREDLATIAGGFGSAVRDAALALPAMVGIDLRSDDAEDVPGMAAPLHATLSVASGGHPGPAAAALLVFVLLYVPCVATVAAIRHELGGRWAALSVGMSLTVAWLAAVAVFQGGRLLTALLATASAVPASAVLPGVG
jgi:ferrous iron transport protein B